jgi:hypothetical protein
VIGTALELSQLNTTEAEVFLNDCTDEGHIPKCDFTETEDRFRDDLVFPTVKICGCRDEPIYVLLRWKGHLDLPHSRFNEFGYNEVATPSLIRQELEKCRQGSAAEHIAPEFPPGRRMEMNCFDSNRCSACTMLGYSSYHMAGSLLLIKIINFGHVARTLCTAD